MYGNSEFPQEFEEFFHVQLRTILRSRVAREDELDTLISEGHFGNRDRRGVLYTSPSPVDHKTWASASKMRAVRVPLPQRGSLPVGPHARASSLMRVSSPVGNRFFSAKLVITLMASCAESSDGSAIAAVARGDGHA